MANAIVTRVTTIDRKADKMQPYFGRDLSITDPFWHCVECEESVGSEPGHAKIIIPNSAGVVDETCFSVAFNIDGPIGQIKHGSPVTIKRRYADPSTGVPKSSKIWVGKVEDIQHRSENNSIEITAYDLRTDLKDVRVYGRYIWNPVSGAVEYQQGWPSHFNPKGRPNRIYTPGGTPCFSPYPDYGLSADQPPSPSQAHSTTTAGYWTLFEMLTYLRCGWAYETPDDNLFAAARNAASASFPRIRRFPSTIYWHPAFATNLDEITNANFNNAVGQNNTIQGGARKGRDLAIKGHSFIGVDGQPGIFDMLFSTAGGWSWCLDAYGDNAANYLCGLRSVQTRYVGGGADIPQAVGGAAKDVLKEAVITASDYKESSRYTISGAVAHGSHVKIETRCSTRAADHAGTPALIPAWTQAEQDAMLTAAVTLAGGGAPTAATFAQAVAQYPNVFALWRLNPNFDFQAGTSESGKPRAKISRPIWPLLLSFAGSSTGSVDITQYPIRFEAYNGTTWSLGPEGDGLEIWDNGNIYVPGLRDIVIMSHGNSTGSFRWTSGVEWEVVGGKLNVTANDVRATIAIPCDHRLEYAVQTVLGVQNIFTAAPMMDDSPHIDRIDASFDRWAYVDLNGLYECWLRVNSYPIPQSAGGTLAPDLENANYSDESIRSDLGGDKAPPDMLQGHTNRFLIDKFGLTCEGGFEFGGYLTELFPLGTSVRRLTPVGGANDRKPFPVARVIARRRWRSVPSKDDNGRDIFINSTKVFPI